MQKVKTEGPLTSRNDNMVDWFNYITAIEDFIKEDEFLNDSKNIKNTKYFLSLDGNK